VKGVRYTTGTGPAVAGWFQKDTGPCSQKFLIYGYPENQWLVIPLGAKPQKTALKRTHIHYYSDGAVNKSTYVGEGVGSPDPLKGIFYKNLYIEVIL
jgi:hypothetical protein